MSSQILTSFWGVLGLGLVTVLFGMVTFFRGSFWRNKVTSMTEITELRIYPIKSCRGIPLKNSFLTKQGLDLDRRWMFVDAETSKFQTIRDHAKMTLIDTSIKTSSSTPGEKPTEYLTISIRNTDKSVTILARPTAEWLAKNTSLTTVEIWNKETDGYAYQDSINSIFSEFFGKPVKLVYKGPTPRIAGGNGAPGVLGREESVNFPDVMPITIANQGSLGELNIRLRAKGEMPITVERFRPNIIVRGFDSSKEGDAAPKPWSEDKWKTVKISSGEQVNGLKGRNDLTIDVQARCARCLVPNVNPETAVAHPHEPWDTLMKYRRVDEGIKFKPCFAMLSCPRQEGPISVGMKFEVTEVTDKHLYIRGM